MNEITITVRPFEMGTVKEAALKPLEEASEAHAAFQAYDRCVAMGHPETLWAEARYVDLADEIADTIQASVNLAARYRIDLPAALKRCEERNRARGRYEQAEAPKVPEMSEGAKKILDRMMAGPCEHEWEHVGNLHGDQINLTGGMRSLWQCKKCGKHEFRPHLFDEGASGKAVLL